MAHRLISLLAGLALAFVLVPTISAKPDPAPQEWGMAYFPLVSGAEYNYKGTFEGKVYPKPVAVRTHDLGAVKGYYFVDFDEKGETSQIVGTNCFGLGSYRYADGKLLTDKAFWTRDLEKIDPKGAQTLLAFPLKAGAKTIVKDGDKVLSLTVVGPETVKVPAGTFEDCVKVTVEELWPKRGVRYEGAVWLARDVGIVKRQYATGRIDELVSYKIPKP
jgi:hypothetical protein